MVRRQHSPTISLRRHDRAVVPVVSLEVYDGARGACSTVELGLQEVVVGTGDDADVVLTDASVSRRHASLRVDESGLLVTDLGSKNGTSINGTRIRSAYAGVDVEIFVGGSRIVPRAASEVEVELSPNASFGGALGASIVMRALFARLERAAATDLTIVLFGESGTGKELLARAIHDLGRRRDGPFIVTDCGALAPGLVEAELFGHERGAFTGAEARRAGVFEQAHGGTLFLDEVGELSPDMQTRLLRALEERAVRRVGGQGFVDVDVRLVAATHRDLAAMVRAGTFRQDLYYRLAVVVARVPTLRERPDDIELLAERFLARLSPPRSLQDVPPNTLAMLKAYSFPGNVRELHNILTRLAVFPAAGIDVLGEPLAAGRQGAFVRLDLGWREARDLGLATIEEHYLRAQLAAHGGNVSETAKAVGVSRQFLHRLLQRYGLHGTR